MAAAIHADLIAAHLKPEVAQAGVIVWPTPERQWNLRSFVADGES